MSVASTRTSADGPEGSIGADDVAGRTGDADKSVRTPLIKGLAHITGGGFLENIPRILPDGVSVEINRGSWPEPPIFGLMQRLGNVDDQEMFRTFNMGIGMVIVCDEANRSVIADRFNDCYEIGRIIPGTVDVQISRS
ncbi:MAG: hypothetical protein IPM59_02910 [Chloracidobacterium sp.]|nr:hypothetical protein [Chloracidobacterium sp.]